MQTEINIYADRVNQVSLYAVKGERNAREYIFNIIEKDGTQIPNSNATIINKMLNLTGYTPRLYIAKPDGTLSYIQGTVLDDVNGRISFTLTSQSVAAIGQAQCNITLTSSSDEDLRLIGLDLIINDSIIDENAIESQDEFSALTEALQTVSKYDSSIAENSKQILSLSNRITPIEKGGTGAATKQEALSSLGAAAEVHNHTVNDIISGNLPIGFGGTGASTAADAFTALSEDTGWIDLPYGENYERYQSTYAPLQYRRIGPLVQIRGTIKRKTALSNVNSIIDVLGVIPAEYSPEYRVHTMYLMGGNIFGGGYIKSGGEICLTWTYNSTPIDTNMWISVVAGYFI